MVIQNEGYMNKSKAVEFESMGLDDVVKKACDVIQLIKGRESYL